MVVHDHGRAKSLVDDDDSFRRDRAICVIGATCTHQYSSFVAVVPTSYRFLNNRDLLTKLTLSGTSKCLDCSRAVIVDTMRSSNGSIQKCMRL
jgi:hypothetical protein